MPIVVTAGVRFPPVGHPKAPTSTSALFVSLGEEHKYQTTWNYKRELHQFMNYFLADGGAGPVGFEKVVNLHVSALAQRKHP